MAYNAVSTPKGIRPARVSIGVSRGTVVGASPTLEERRNAVNASILSQRPPSPPSISVPSPEEEVPTSSATPPSNEKQMATPREGRALIRLYLETANVLRGRTQRESADKHLRQKKVSPIRK